MRIVDRSATYKIKSKQCLVAFCRAKKYSAQDCYHVLSALRGPDDMNRCPALGELKGHLTARIRHAVCGVRIPPTARGTYYFLGGLYNSSPITEEDLRTIKMLVGILRKESDQPTTPADHSHFLSHLASACKVLRKHPIFSGHGEMLHGILSAISYNN